MTNLEYLDKFLTETYGSICFHNDKEDGFVNFEEDSKKQMETLAVYFPCALDLQSKEITKRLIKVAGKDFYKRYVGNEGVKITPLFGCVTIARYVYNNKTLWYDYDVNFSMYNIVREIVGYFLGDETFKAPISKLYKSIKILPANNDFKTNQKLSVKECIENYLNNKGLPLVNEVNNFEMFEKIKEIINNTNKDSEENLLTLLYKHFDKERKIVQDIYEKRHEIYKNEFNSLSVLERNDFIKKYLSIDIDLEKNISKSPNFDD